MEPEHRVQTASLEEHVVGAVGIDAVEELTDLEAPAAQVGAEHRHLLFVGELHGDVLCPPTTEQEVEPTAVGADVAHPLTLAAR
jgi:hypothetical protein